MDRRYFRLAAAPLLYFCLGCFVNRDLFVIAAGVVDVNAWSPGVLLIGLGGILGGLLQARADPARVAYGGAILLGLGFVGLGFALPPIWHFLAFEVCIGCGSGIAYAAGVPLALRSSSGRLGLVIGIAVAGYVPAGILGTRVAMEAIERFGWSRAAHLTGIALIVLSFAAIKVLQAVPSVAPKRVEQVGPLQMIGGWPFASLWLGYAFASAGAMMTYTLLPQYAATLAASEGSDRVATVIDRIGQASALANFAARPLTGWVADFVGHTGTLWLVVVPILAASIVAPLTSSPDAIVLLAFLVLGGYGAALAAYPIITAKWFGVRHVGANYGLVFSAWAFGYTVGKWLGPALVRTFETTVAAFWGAVIVSCFAVALAGISARHGRLRD